MTRWARSGSAAVRFLASAEFERSALRLAKRRSPLGRLPFVGLPKNRALVLECQHPDGGGNRPHTPIAEGCLKRELECNTRAQRRTFVLPITTRGPISTTIFGQCENLTCAFGSTKAGSSSASRSDATLAQGVRSSRLCGHFTLRCDLGNWLASRCVPDRPQDKAFRPAAFPSRSGPVPRTNSDWLLEAADPRPR